MNSINLEWVLDFDKPSFRFLLTHSLRYDEVLHHNTFFFFSISTPATRPIDVPIVNLPRTVVD